MDRGRSWSTIFADDPVKFGRAPFGTTPELLEGAATGRMVMSEIFSEGVCALVRETSEEPLALCEDPDLRDATVSGLGMIGIGEADTVIVSLARA